MWSQALLGGCGKKLLQVNLIPGAGGGTDPGGRSPFLSGLPEKASAKKSPLSHSQCPVGMLKLNYFLHHLL